MAKSGAAHRYEWRSPLLLGTHAFKQAELKQSNAACFLYLGESVLVIHHDRSVVKSLA